MPSDPGPTVRRRQLGAVLRRYREDAGMTVSDVAGHLLCSATKISRIETAQRNPTLRDVRDLCDLYRISDAVVRQQLMTMAQESRQRAWWQAAGLEPALETLIGLEGSATTIREFETSAFPGLIQTRPYADAMLANWHPAGSPQRERAVELRMRRQEILTGDQSPRLEIILDEAALRRLVGGPDVMREQLRHAIELSERAAITLRVVPFSAGAHQGMNSGFILLDFSNPVESPILEFLPPVVYVEGLAGELYLDQIGDVERYARAFENLTAQALPTSETVKLIRKIVHEL
ncbi:helix-turn-helix domain-containing protein [Paractinoplanes rishiriensis]|uniref:Transcriptional regulator n=1 Tax=Paractinoplanes rishiriensis TaxID=1050105 RepID=A0A919N1X9_9ACTN|nr:helix-turn-helix transcriptional regulator [Actinoplanes rishiriensis]GIE98092.1 transcriptional regulator [Actinoplanes rishiriensis]